MFLWRKKVRRTNKMNCNPDNRVTKRRNTYINFVDYNLFCLATALRDGHHPSKLTLLFL